jgi:predicted acylesterase/phospholipase RssA
MILIPPKRICLSGGGIRATAFLGALEVLESHGLLRSVKEYIGVSAGALIAYGIVLGYTIQELKKLCMEFDFTLIRNVEPESAIGFMDEFGFDKGDNLRRFLESLLKQKNLAPETTFEDLSIQRPSGPTLRCFATDLNVCMPREFSNAITPTVKLTDALLATMSLTFYFTPIIDPLTGHYLTDGGVLHNYPMAFLSPEERTHSLGLMFSNDHAENKMILDFYDFLHQLFACVYMPRTRKILAEAKYNTIVLPHGDYPSWNFEATKEEKIVLMNAAAKATEVFLESNTHPKPLRRYSVS